MCIYNHNNVNVIAYCAVAILYSKFDTEIQTDLTEIIKLE